MDLQLGGKKALVTGSTAGIGFAIALELCREGAVVTLTGRTEERINEAIEHIKSQVPNAHINGYAVDFGKKDEVEGLIRALPLLDILINNVGIFEPKAFEEILDEDWYRFFEINVMSGIRLSRHYFPKMMQQDQGRILFISSESGIQIPDEMIHYGMTKSAQLSVSRGLAELTKGSNVTVNCVLPGPTKSEGVTAFVEKIAQRENKSTEDIEKDFFKEERPTSLLQRFISVEEVAAMAVYLCSPRASATNGAAVRVDGGVVKSMT
ncbi:SDR family NAD(P)-dependent oxidoreductase [Negadavirga shengliensis]|uniref:SDR family NAD(P)-dependent oxidoreductase n=1 Tax=Negadavirga shengliensis TaxID=1389218 RepID=A0ABV9T003_9BACT